MAERLRNHVVLSDTPPVQIPTGDDLDPQRDPASGDLWVDSNYFVIYCFDENEVTNAMGGWVGVTDRSNTGSIVYFRDTEPDLTDLYPALNNLPDGAQGIIDNADGENGPIDISPLPGTMWFDTSVSLLKIFLVSEVNSRGAWVSVTSAHYMTQAVNAGLEAMEQRVAALEAQVGITP